MDTPFDPTLETDIKELMKEVPAPVRAFFASGKVETVAKNLMQKYRLHIDQGAVVEREVILLLLGLKGPEDFAKTLAEEAKLDQVTVNGIVQDVNAQIFVPLRDEMRKGPTAVQQSPKPAQTQTLSTPPTAPKYTPIPKFPHLSLGGETPKLKLLEDHEEPHIKFHPTSPTATKGVAKTAPPPTNLPGAIHHPPLPAPFPKPIPAPFPKPIPPTVPPPKPTVAPPPARPYSSDPYREPIEP